ncbi:hypothetical protein HDV05_006782 [Chytridiales sp. JEL 0842]|nr:hypothetical protein HDV05_006782 [Chytridiales sp. JEL 0842]
MSILESRLTMNEDRVVDLTKNVNETLGRMERASQQQQQAQPAPRQQEPKTYAWGSMSVNSPARSVGMQAGGKASVGGKEYRGEEGLKWGDVGSEAV